MVQAFKRAFDWRKSCSGFSAGPSLLLRGRIEALHRFASGRHRGLGIGESTLFGKHGLFRIQHLERESIAIAENDRLECGLFRFRRCLIQFSYKAL